MTRKVPAAARSQLDLYIQQLSRFSDDLTIEDFRTSSMIAAKNTQLRVQIYVVVGGFFFLTMALGVLAAQSRISSSDAWATMLSAAIWSLALGGLGVIASIFVHLLKLTPQQTLKTTDEFEVFGRIILGCLFSTVISITLVHDIFGFFSSLENLTAGSAVQCAAAHCKPVSPGQNTGLADLKSGPMALLPFLLGYSIPLALRILEKIILAVETTIGAEDRRATATIRGTARKQKRGS